MGREPHFVVDFGYVFAIKVAPGCGAFKTYPKERPGNPGIPRIHATTMVSPALSKER